MLAEFGNSSLVRLGLMRSYPSSHDDDWTDSRVTLVSIVLIRCAPGMSVNGKRTFPLRRKTLQSSSPRGVLMEIGFCGNSLDLLMGEMCWDDI